MVGCDLTAGQGADGDGNGSLTRGEFVTTRPKLGKQAKCGCR